MPEYSHNLHNWTLVFARLSIKMLLFNELSIISRTNEREASFQCGGFLDMQIGMPALVIDWVKEEAKMAKIIRDIYVCC